MTGPLVYGLAKTVGIFFFVLLVTWTAKREGLDQRKVLLGTFFIVISGYLGGRLWYILQHWNWFSEGRFGNTLWSWTSGGDVLYGWVVGGFLGIYVVAKAQNLPPFKLLDICYLFAIFGQAIGRWGCYVAGCCYGKKTSLPWGVRYPFLDFSVHPVQLYEIGTDLLLFVFLLVFYARHKQREGETTLAYFVLYPASRFVLEFFRGNQEHFWLGLTIPQMTSLILILIALTLMKTCSRNSR